MKKILTVLMSTSLTLTACSDDSAPKTKSVNDIGKSAKIEESAGNTKNTTKSSNKHEKILNLIRDFDVEKLPVMKKEKNELPRAYIISSTKEKFFEEKINDYNDTKAYSTIEKVEYSYSNALEGKIGTKEGKHLSGSKLKSKSEVIISNEEFANKYVNGNATKVDSNNKNAIENMNKEVRAILPNVQEIASASVTGDKLEIELTPDNYKEILKAHFTDEEIDKIEKETISGSVSVFANFTPDGEFINLGYIIRYRFTDKDGLSYANDYNLQLSTQNVQIESITEAKI